MICSCSSKKKQKQETQNQDQTIKSAHQKAIAQSLNNNQAKIMLIDRDIRELNEKVIEYKKRKDNIGLERLKYDKQKYVLELENLLKNTENITNQLNRVGELINQEHMSQSLKNNIDRSKLLENEQLEIIENKKKNAQIYESTKEKLEYLKKYEDYVNGTQQELYTYCQQ